MAGKEKDDAKQRILESAAQLFAKNGIHATSLADISQQAQVSKGTLYYHFTTKDALICEVGELHMSHMTTKMYVWLSSVHEKSDVRAVFSELLDMLTDDVFHVKLHMSLLSEATLGNEALQTLIRAKYSEMGLLLDLASLRMDMALHESKNLKQMFFMALDGLMLHSLIGMDSIESRELLERIYM